VTDGTLGGRADMIDTGALFRPLHVALIELLRGLAAGDWERPLAEPRLLRPAIHLSLFALPPALAGIDRPDGTAVSLTASGAAGGAWHLQRRDGAWRLTESVPDAAAVLSARAVMV
jgi:hypothetical protein